MDGLSSTRVSSKQGEAINEILSQISLRQKKRIPYVIKQAADKFSTILTQNLRNGNLRNF